MIEVDVVDGNQRVARPNAKSENVVVDGIAPCECK